MWSKINIVPIIRDHLQTLKRSKEEKLSRSDCFLFFGVPAGFALLIICLWDTPGKGLVEVLTTAFSIFAALLFNLLVLVYDLVKRHETRMRQALSVEGKDFTQRPKLKTEVLQETYANISFCTLIAIVTIGVLLPLYPEVLNSVIALLLSFIMYYLVGVFLLTLLMILKRTHLLMKDDITTEQL